MGLKIIFLDIDGVMNSDLFSQKRNQEQRKKKRYKGDNIDEQCVEYLNELIKDTGAKVVISSSWRKDGIDYCRKHLEAKGFVGEIIDITPNLRHEGCLRGNEIYHWINKNTEILGVKNGSDFKEYVIFDDDSDMLLWQQDNFILVDSHCGLTPNQCYRAKFILCRDMTFSDSFNSDRK